MANQEKTTGKAEYMIENVAGCGTFQITFYAIVGVVLLMSTMYSTIFMAFGNYNPGWRCLDNVTGTRNDNTSLDNDTLVTYDIGSCSDYEKCRDVEFNPTTSTIITEWGLTCDRSWIVSVIISIQMVGLLIGCYFGGLIADRIGRKKTVLCSLVICCVSQLISPFSVSWVMFSISRFFIGMTAICNTNLCLVYMSEFMTRKWRAFSLVIPSWTLGAVLMALMAWVTEDWRKVDFIGFGIASLGLFTFVLWTPESLRWLEVMNKRKEFIKVSRRIAKLNGMNADCFDESMLSEYQTESTDGNKYNILDLFRKGYRLITVCIAFLNFAFSLLFYTLSFGAKSFYGHFYFNLIMMNVISLPIALLAIFAIRVMRRRSYAAVFLGTSFVCSVLTVIMLLVGDKTAKDFGSTILICVAMATTDAAWSGVYASTMELYPTVVRGIGVGMGSMSARVGGIIAPFLIPDDESVLYIFMIMMALLTLVCCGVCLKLPETKGKPLKETFEDGERKDRFETEQEL